MEEQIQIVELGEKSIRKIAKEVHKLDLAEKKKIRDNAYHNTKVLLKNYNKLKKHCEIVDEQLTEELGTLWSDWRFDLNSLLENKAKTAKLMVHVDKALLELKKEDEAKFNLIKRKYFTKGAKTDDMTISLEQRIERSVLTKRMKVACTELAILLFGVDVILFKTE
ncbi:hypothetical protein [Enterococcus sp. 5H]|uniref:hypothetical protein n=1 Tax=Enterococcus sp. 5H TaxID=1229490 RepID=UPI00230459A7|nr:hypothetical protein [Enterococcus sp. 5H]MDA9472655.1 hypothetical protein [Enterococcus sp. 5H]